MLIKGNCIQIMKKIESNSIDMIFSDPPYFLSNGGKTIKNGKIVSVNKGEWDMQKYYKNHDIFTYNWIKESYRLLKNSGTIWITCTMHNLFVVEKQIKNIGFQIINIIIWKKPTPPPLIYKNKFRFSYEFIIWAKKSKNYYFNYQEMFKIDNREMEDVWILPSVSKEEKKFGYHPTQKPELLLERIIKATTKVGDVVLDPFMGSGTTCYVAKKYNRKFIGIEREPNYFDIAKNRVESISKIKNGE